ncbi:MAG: helix-turn-helix transcriptional regulator [Oligosphaeraceae bacterium]|nr:helix-turn-helix transcriptional regulator [Oligosphaeraceae bacterium]
MNAAPDEYVHGIMFDGNLDAGMRQLIRQKRLQLGLSYQRLAAFFNVDWSTIRKWEQGPTNRCNALWQSLLENFINGEMDHLFADAKPDLGLQYGCRPPSPGPVRICQHQLGCACELLQNHPDLQDELLQNVFQSVQVALRELLLRQAQASKKSPAGTSVRARQSNEKPQP